MATGGDQRAVIPELGHAALWLAFAVALVQAIVPLWGASTGHGRAVALAPNAAFAQLILSAIAFGALTWAYVRSDFSVRVVAANSHTLKPMLYKVTGVWGNHEGSLLLWVLVLAASGAAVALFSGNLPATFRARVLSVLGMVAVGFHGFMLFTSSPFERLSPAPPEGNGLNPLLQDPGLAFHPPTLYAGYVGLSVAFAFAVAALIEGRVGREWARWVKPWTLTAWGFLTLGIAMGSWWAYYELGWGGWWFWDPVENASLMPWLAATALFHSAIVVEKRDALKSWTILLAIIAFSLSLIGTFIVRSGLITSVHSFALDPARGIFILGLLGFFIGGALLLYGLRASALEPTGGFAAVSKEGSLVANNLLLAAALGTVFIGTLYPLALELVAGKQISVGPPYFNATFIPLMAALMALMVVGPLLAWKRGRLGDAVQKLRTPLAVALMALVALAALAHERAVLALLGFALSLALVAGLAADLRARRRLRGLPAEVWAMVLGHLGMAVACFGITAIGAWQKENLTILAVGDSTRVGAFEVRLEAVDPVAGPNYTALRATMRATRDGQPVAVLTPEARVYDAPVMETTEAAIHPLWNGDLYAVIGEETADGRWSVRLHWKPFVLWIWAGAIIMTLGGAVSVLGRWRGARAPGVGAGTPAVPAPAE